MDKQLRTYKLIALILLISSMKILHLECGGSVIYHLRLEEG